MRAFGLLIGSMLALSAGAAMAQEAPEQEGLEDIIVTARKAAEDLQEAPLSVSAYTAATLERLGIADLGDVAQRTPGMQFGDFGDIKLSPTSLRGIVGDASSAGADPAVGYYVDEVFVGQGAGANIDLFDIARVEVLRGPQGVLFGRNTIGGVISITTERPSDTFEASALAEFGDFDHRRFAASISGPLGDSVSAKLAVSGRERGGTSENVWLDRDVNTLGSWSARSQFLFELNSNTELALTADYNAVDQEPLVYETIRYNEATTLPQVLDLNGLPRNTNANDRNVYSDSINEETLDAIGFSARFVTEIGGVGVTNIASYRTHDYYNRNDTDRSPLSILYDGDPEEVSRWSEELRLDWSTGPVDWIAGVYYFQQTTDNQSFVEVGSDLADLIGDPSLTGVLAGSTATLDTTSTALFASATWAVNERLDIALGGRYTRDEKEIAYIQTDPIALLGGDANINASDEWSEFTPNANVRYRFTPDILGYATVSRGFKSGGFNDALGSGTGIAFDTETLWNYEIGLKSEFFDRRLRVNVAVFYMDWASIQVLEDNPATPAIYDPITTNAGAAHSQGIEIEIDAAPTDQLRLGASFSLLEAQFDEGALPNGDPLQRIPFSPDYTASFNAQYTWPLPSGDEVSLLGEYVARGEAFLGYDNQPDSRVDPYGLVNLRLAYAHNADAGDWSVALWGRNLTDETYNVRMFDLYDLDFVGQRFAILGDPRTYGVELRYEY